MTTGKDLLKSSSIPLLKMGVQSSIWEIRAKNHVSRRVVRMRTPARSFSGAANKKSPSLSF